MGIIKTAMGLRGERRVSGVDPAFQRLSIFDHYRASSYATAYPNIRTIANKYMTVRPFAIDGNGKQVPHEVVNALYHPNKSDSSVAFAEKVAVSTLSLRKTYILVWSNYGGTANPGGDFMGQGGKNIAGFTFLEFPRVSRVGGKTTYTVGTQTFTEDEVLVLPGGVDPNDLYAGYSPSEASRRWATLDDYIADFQAGFFENGAVPAGQFIITAPTRQAFQESVAMLQDAHRGAGSNNNVTYTHRPVNIKTGVPSGSAAIEWVPFSQPNKDIDFENLFKQVDRRIDTSFGVSAIMKGIDDTATYANAQVSKQVFAENVVDPLLLRNYTQLTHELNRITGGMGVAITYEFTIPQVVDEVKVQAEADDIRINSILKLEAAGYSTESIIDALKLPNNFKLLRKGDYKPSEIENDKPDVDEGDEVADAPDRRKVGDTGAWGEANGTSPKASADNQPQTLDDFEQLIYDATTEFMQKQVDRAVAESRQTAENSTEEDDEQNEFAEALLLIIVALMIVQGAIYFEDGKQLLIDNGVSTAELTGFVVAASTQEAYRAYLLNVARSYADDTAASIRRVLDHAASHGWAQSELEEKLRGIMKTDEWRVQRMARTEISRADALSSVEAMKQVQNQTGTLIEKAMESETGKPCEFCATLIDKWVAVDEPILNLNEAIIGRDGGIFINNFAQNDGYDVHPNGHCHPKYRVVKAYLNAERRIIDDEMADLDLRCEECGRYLNIKGVTQMIAQVRCSNAKCKHVNNIKIVNAASTDEQMRYEFDKS